MIIDLAQIQQSFWDEFAPVTNVFVFPSLDAGDVGYKVTPRIGGGGAFGPVLQGLRLPANDFSRGADWEDIANVAAITAVQAGTAD